MPAEKRTLTDKFVRSLGPATLGKRGEFWDDRVPGFGVRVTDRGAKSYVLYTRWPPTGHPARRALGNAEKLSLEAARKMARRWLDLIEQGIDPREQKRQDKLEAQRRVRTTFEVVAEDWLREVVVGQQRKAAEVARDVRRVFVAKWGTRPVTEISTLDVRDIIRSVRDAGAPAQARNLLGYTKRLFAWAVAQDAYGISESPAERLRPKDIVGKKVVRQRVLADPELRALWRVAGALPYPYGPLFRMLALTGQRKSEVAEARWREFDLQQKVWTIPAQRMKGDAAHVVPLSDDVITILNSLPRFKKGDHLFSTTFGAKPVNGFSKSKTRLDKAMRAEIDGELEHFTIHDIRRTMRTGLSALPIPDRVRELVIAHAQPGLHKVYDQHSYLDEKRRALDLWAARLRTIVDPTTGENVVHLHAAGS